MSDDIVARLRERARYDGWATEDVLSGEAADEIARLRAENERLREALKETLAIALRNEAGDYVDRALAAIEGVTRKSGAGNHERV